MVLVLAVFHWAVAVAFSNGFGWGRWLFITGISIGVCLQLAFAGDMMTTWVNLLAAVVNVLFLFTLPAEQFFAGETQKPQTPRENRWAISRTTANREFPMLAIFIAVNLVLAALKSYTQYSIDRVDIAGIQESARRLLGDPSQPFNTLHVLLAMFLIPAIVVAVRACFRANDSQTVGAALGGGCLGILIVNLIWGSMTLGLVPFLAIVLFAVLSDWMEERRKRDPRLRERAQSASRRFADGVRTGAVFGGIVGLLLAATIFLMIGHDGTTGGKTFVSIFAIVGFLLAIVFGAAYKGFRDWSRTPTGEYTR